MMYPPAIFSDDDLDAGLDIAGATKFATVVTIDTGSILPVHVPLSLRPRDARRDEQSPEFVGHIITSNPLLARLKKGDLPATVIFQPAEGYVSPGTYDEKRRSGKVVPTWNYVAAHFQGSLHLEQADGALRRILEIQIADFEGAVGGTWTLDDAPADYIDKMASAIAGFSFAVTDWRTIRKLSQNKPDERANVVRWLDDNALPASSITYWMRQEF
jgi:transcriptional regulator